MSEERLPVTFPTEVTRGDREAGIGEVNGTPANLDSGNNSPKLDECDIFLRPARSTDEAFLYATFASTRIDELAVTGWKEEQKEQFLRFQFEAQRQSYLSDLPTAEYFVIESGPVPVGRLILERTATEIHIVDIALLTQFRKLGIGSTLMRRLFAEARQHGKSVRLFVEQFNPTLHWYKRLGFKVTSTGPIYFEMIWKMGAAHPADWSGLAS